MEYIILLYLALPTFIANMMPVVAQRLKLFKRIDKPLDNGFKIFNKRLFGDHKTVRGLIVGVVSAVIVSLMQYLLSILNLIEFNMLISFNEFLLFGFLSGFGAILGDALASTIKRQANIASGDPFIIFDQVDYMIGYLLLTSLIIPWSWHSIWFLLLFSLIVHPIINIIAFVFKIKKTYW